MVVIFSEPITRRYYASRFSGAYCLMIVVTVVSIILPFFIAYSASGPHFWSKEKTYWEKPEVKYQYKFIQILEGTKDYGSAPLSLFFSSMNNVNTAFGGSNLRFPLIRSKEIDDEGDGLYDRLEFSSEMPLADGEEIMSSKLFVFFKYKLSTWSRVSLYTMGYYQYSSPIPGASLFMDGDLNWKQSWPLPARRGFHTPYLELMDDTLVLPWTDGNHTLQNFLPNLISSFRSQNYTTDLEDKYSLWGASGQTLYGNGYKDKKPISFNLTTTIRYPITSVTYTPNVSEVLFDAWIKYFSMFVVTSWLLFNCFCHFVFHHHLLDTHEHVENEPITTFSRFKRHLS